MIHLVAFADSRMRRSLVRLSKQAEALKVFDQVHLLDETDLPTDFRRRFSSRLVVGSRGYGYWSWKPEIIKTVFDKMEFGDKLLYVDAGCHLNSNGKSRLLEYFAILDEPDNAIVAFQADPPNPENSSLKYDGRPLFEQPNFRWIKGDLFDHFGVRGDPSFTNSQAIGAGVILFRKCNAASKVVDEWRSLVWERFDLLDDTPSASPNFPGFIEHRHDQAIWTLLCLKYGVKTVSAYEYWYPRRNNRKLFPDWQALRRFPIHAKRDKDMGLVANTLKRVMNFGSRVLRIPSKVSKTLGGNGGKNG